MQRQSESDRSPNLNSTAERFVLSLKIKCLDLFCIFEEKHLRHLFNEYIVRCFHFERPNQEIGNVPLMADDQPATVKFPAGRVRRRKRLGGLLKRYFRIAA